MSRYRLYISNRLYTIQLLVKTYWNVASLRLISPGLIKVSSSFYSIVGKSSFSFDSISNASIIFTTKRLRNQAVEENQKLHTGTWHILDFSAGLSAELTFKLRYVHMDSPCERRFFAFLGNGRNSEAITRSTETVRSSYRKEELSRALSNERSATPTVPLLLTEASDYLVLVVAQCSRNLMPVACCSVT